MNVETNAILNELEPLFTKAENENLWFYSLYQQLWFTPKELKEHQAQGRFVWGATNWVLRSPFEKLEDLERRKELIHQDIEDVKRKILNL